MKCRPGDSAIVIGAHDEHDVGLIVRVIQLDDKRLGYDYLWDGPTWWVECTALLTWTNQDNELVQAYAGPLPASMLHPIRGACAEADHAAVTGDIHDYA